MNQLPVSTQWILDAAGETGRAAVKSVLMIVCPKTSSKGTGFVLRNGLVVTNEHVVRDCSATEIHAQSPLGAQVSFDDVRMDGQRDLAILQTSGEVGDGLVLDLSADFDVGTTVTTWGFPLGYNGPAPLLSVGYLAGFAEHTIGGKARRHLVVNGAFNPGNSGGPLLRANDEKVIGVVVSKHAPITPFHESALQALASNKTGVTFTSTDEKGQTTTFVESQIVADLLFYLRDLTQVMIGEAIAAPVLADYLGENGFDVPTG